jgi:hypothetical protein
MLHPLHFKIRESVLLHIWSLVVEVTLLAARKWP